MNVLVIGATGLIGRSLCRELTNEGHVVSATSRSPDMSPGLAVARIHQWDPQAGAPSPSTLDGVDAVVNLAGESIDAQR